MTLYEQIIALLPELTNTDFGKNGSISLKNDGDGDYISRWEYLKPIPDGLKLGK